MKVRMLESDRDVVNALTRSKFEWLKETRASARRNIQNKSPRGSVLMCVTVRTLCLSCQFCPSHLERCTRGHPSHGALDGSSRM